MIFRILLDVSANKKVRAKNNLINILTNILNIA